jgi:hypothetical protein
MMKNKLAVGLAMAAITGFASSYALAAPQVLAGDKIKLSSTPWGGANGGGEFKASALTGDSPSFNTFCIEYSEHFYYDKPLLVSKVNTGAKNGGAGGSVIDPLGDPDGGGPYNNKWDPIDNRTAFLFTKFTQQSLANYEFGSANAAQNLEHKRDSESLQLAIWYLEEEISSTLNTTVYNRYMSADVDGVGQEARDFVTLATAANWTNNGQVKVLNLLRQSDPSSATNPFNTLAQDQLYLQPIPEPETYAMMLAGLGLIGFVANRRRRKHM